MSKYVKITAVLTVCTLAFFCTEQTHQSDSFPENIVNLAITTHDGHIIEIPGLYDSLVSVLPAGETTKLGAILSAKGFTLTDTGQGNWNKGPQYVERTYTKGTCTCTVSKMYYQITTDSTLLEIHESINCKELKK